MLDGFNAILSAFAEFVSMFFSLPFYGSITLGWLIVTIEIIGLIVVYLIARFRR